MILTVATTRDFLQDLKPHLTKILYGKSNIFLLFKPINYNTETICRMKHIFIFMPHKDSP